MALTVTGWNDAHTPPTSMADMAAAPWGTVIAVGASGRYVRSAAALAWTDFDLSMSVNFFGVAHGAQDEWVIVGVDWSENPVILRSDDDGLTFTACTTDLTAIPANNSINQRIAYRSATSTWVALIHDADTTCTSLVSVDGGDTWTTATGPSVTSGGVVRLRCDETSGRFIAIHEDTTVSASVSDDDGATWAASSAFPGTGAVYVIDVVRVGSSLIACGLDDAGVTATPRTWVSNNSGDSFSQLSPTGVGTAPRVIGAVVAYANELVAVTSNEVDPATVVVSSNGVAFTGTNAPGVALAEFIATITGSRLLLYVIDDSYAHHIFEATVAAIAGTSYDDIVNVFSRGAVYYRLAIEGADAEWCSDIALAGSSTEGRLRYSGLIMEGAVLSEHAELREGTTKISPLSLRIQSDAADVEFGKAATKLAYLAAGVETADATAIDVTNDGLLTDNQYIHIGTECLQITDIDAGTLTVTRQLRGTRPQAHYRAAVSSAPGWEVPVYDKPPTLQGRRVALTAFPVDLNGEETIVWQGVLATHPYQDADGVSWRLDIDHLSRLLDQTIGNTLSGDTALANAVYHQACQFSFSIEYERAGVTIGPVQWAIEGVFESDDEFLAELQSQMDGAGTTGITWSVYRNDGGFLVFEATTDTSFADDNSDLLLEVRIGSALDGVCGGVSFDGYGGRPGTGVLSDSTTKYFVLSQTRKTGWSHATYAPSALALPIFTSIRGCVGDPKVGAFPFTDLFEDEANTDSEFVLYLSRDIGCIANRTVITLTDAIWPDDGSRFDIDLDVTAVADSGQTITVRGWNSIDFQHMQDKGWLAAPCFYYDDATRVTSRVNYGVGTWRDLLQTVVNESYLANTGATPFVVASDLEGDDFFTAEVSRRMTFGGDYQPAIETALIDILSPELVLTGCLLRMSANGLISVAPLMKPSPLVQTSIDIDDSVIVTPYAGNGAWPVSTPTPDGVVCSVVIKSGEDTFRVVDEIALSHYKNRGAGTLELEPKSVAPLTVEEASALGRRLLSFFGSAHSVVTVPVNHRAMGVLVGDYVRLVSPHLIDPATGLRGVDTVALCIGREWNLAAIDDRWGEITLITFHTATGGYAPSAVVTAVSGDYTTLAETTVTVTANYYAPDGENDLDHFAVGDAVRVTAFDTTSTLGFRGIITSIPDATTCVIDVNEYLGAPGLRTLHMEFDSALAGVTENQAPYVYIADADGDIDGQNGFEFE